MNTVSIELDDQRRQFVPGGKLSGRADWTGTPRSVEVRLFWFTSGRALRQVGVVSRFAINNAKDRKSARFEFILPRGPWSFAGRAVTLHWAVEAVLIPSRESAIAMFSFGPEGRRLNPFREEDADAESQEFEAANLCAPPMPQEVEGESAQQS
jgi:hypothetical protein